MVKQIAVLGLGEFGYNLAQDLYSMGHEVLGVDIDAVKVQDIVDHVTYSVRADIKEEDVLSSLGLSNFDIVVVCVGDDMETSIFATVILKEMGCKWVIAKAKSDLEGRILKKVGANQVVYPEKDMALRLAQSLGGSNILDFIDLSDDYRIVEIMAPAHFHGKTLADLNLRAKWGISVIAIKNEAKQIKVNPGAQEVIKTGDLLILIGESKEFDRFSRSK